MEQVDRAALRAELRRTGMDPFSVQREVMDAFPEEFLFLYEILWLRAFGRSVGAVKGGRAPNPVHDARRTVRVSTGQTETRGGAHGSRGVGNPEIVANEGALRKKRKIDRKLRAIARDIKAWMGEDVRAGERRCTLCKQFAEDTWLYCPRDGAPTEERF